MLGSTIDDTDNAWDMIFINRNVINATYRSSWLNDNLIMKKVNNCRDQVTTIKPVGIYLYLNIIHAGAKPLIWLDTTEHANVEDLMRQLQTMHGDFIHFYFLETTRNKNGILYLYIIYYIDIF